MQTASFIFTAALLAAGINAQADGLKPDESSSTVSKTASIAPSVLSPDAKVEGVSFGEWTARWWQWAVSLPVEPYMDPDGRMCAMGQGGPVWFLAGTDGSFTARRNCVVPADKYLLVPVINMVHMSIPGAKQAHSCAALQKLAAVNNDHLVSAVVLIDGVALKNVAQYRVRSDGCFPMDPAARADETPKAAADGYWILLKPLSAGRHTLSIGANYGTKDAYGNMRQNFEYVLDVGGRTDLATEGTLPAALAMK